MPPARKSTETIKTRPAVVPVGSLPEGAGFAVPDLGITGEFLGLSGADAKVRFTRGGSSKVEVQHWTAACLVLRGEAATAVIEPRIISLKCEDDGHRFDQSVRQVEVVRETDSAWFGRPAANPNCPVLEYPKFAWKVVKDAPRPATPKPPPTKATPVQRPAPKVKPPAVILEEVIHVAPKIERLV